MRLIPAEVLSVSNCLTMRRIRNSCRDFMTRDQSYIGIIRQVNWYYEEYVPASKQDTWCAWLFKFEGKFIGYGMIRKLHQDWWLSGGLLPDWRSMGFGKEIFSYLIQEAGPRRDHIFLEVRSTNTTAQRLYASLGFHITRSNGAVIEMGLL